MVAGGVFLLVPEHRRVNWPPWSAPRWGCPPASCPASSAPAGRRWCSYFKLGGADKASFRGNLMAVFLLLTLVRWPSYAVAGLITARGSPPALLLLPAVLLGAFIGHRLHTCPKRASAA